MKLEIDLSEDAIHKIAKKVASINKESSTVQREIVIPSEKDFQYTVSEVAKMCKVSQSTITLHIRAKLLTATKIGKSWKISQENYLKYISNENTTN